MLFKDLYDYLEKKGFKVCSLGQQDKICTKPFILYFDAGEGETNISKNLNKQSVELWLFYPYGEFSKFEGFKKDVEKAIKDFGKLRQNYDPTPVSTDDDMKAYYTKLSYFRYVQRRR